MRRELRERRPSDNRGINGGSGDYGRNRHGSKTLVEAKVTNISNFNPYNGRPGSVRSLLRTLSSAMNLYLAADVGNVHLPQ